MAGDEDISIRAVIEYERKRGRKAVDARQSHRGTGIDVVSDRIINIQVKSNLESPSTFWLSLTDFERLQADTNYRIYYVHDLHRRPKVIELDPDTVRSLIYPELKFVVSPDAEMWRRIFQNAKLRGLYDEIDFANQAKI